MPVLPSKLFWMISHKLQRRVLSLLVVRMPECKACREAEQVDNLQCIEFANSIAGCVFIHLLIDGKNKLSSLCPGGGFVWRWMLFSQSPAKFLHPLTTNFSGKFLEKSWICGLRGRAGEGGGSNTQGNIFPHCSTSVLKI